MKKVGKWNDVKVETGAAETARGFTRGEKYM
jgi:hypothetical protein